MEARGAGQAVHGAADVDAVTPYEWERNCEGNLPNVAFEDVPDQKADEHPHRDDDVSLYRDTPAQHGRVECVRALTAAAAANQVEAGWRGRQCADRR